MGENGKMENLQEALEKSVDDCNKHYCGMVSVYKALLVLAQEKVDMSLLEEELKGVLQEVKQNDPFSHGVSDGMQRAKRIIEDLKGGSQTVAEVTTLLTSEVDRMSRVITPIN